MSLTEIKDSLDLLWRNGIPSSQVNLGLAFYARTSTLNPGGCALPGCEHASAGIQGPCSQSVGTLTNAELQPIIAQSSPTLYTDAAVKAITWDGNQWAAYDDVDTWTLKVDFAKSECLGGVFVWAISQDSSDTASSLGIVTATEHTVIQSEEDNTNNPLTVSETYNQEQCKWSNCNEDCPKDFSTVLRNDKDKNYAGEIMQDDSYCDGIGKRVFCCPNALPQPACGWYNFNGGACNNPTCPPGYTEVGSSRSGCRGTWTYQAACCEVEDHTAQTNAKIAMALYNQCSWAGHTKSCAASYSNGASELVGSWAGSGAVRCDLENGISNDQSLYYQYRPYCCDQPSNQQEFTDCNWYNDWGESPRNKDSDTYCMSGCPANMARVAMSNRVAVPGDTFATKNCLKGGGAAAYCCNVVNNATREVLNPKLTAFHTLVLAWAAAPVCPAASISLTKRSSEIESLFNDSAVAEEDL